MSNSGGNVSPAAMDAFMRAKAEEAIRISQKMDYRGDRTHLPVQVQAKALLALLDRVRVAEATVLDMRLENSMDGANCER